MGQPTHPTAIPPALHHEACGQPVTNAARCAAGHHVEADDITVAAAGPFGLDDPISLETWEGNSA